MISDKLYILFNKVLNNHEFLICLSMILLKNSAFLLNNYIFTYNMYCATAFFWYHLPTNLEPNISSFIQKAAQLKKDLDFL